MLCAMDFALSDGINKASVSLVKRKIIGAIACLPISDLWPHSAQMLQQVYAEQNVSFVTGVQLTLTGGFSPLSNGFVPANAIDEGALPRLEDLAKAARIYALDAKVLEAEFRTQIRRFSAHWGAKPDFVMLDDTIVLFGQASSAVTAALAQFKLSQLPVITPNVPRPKGLRERILRQLVWHSEQHQKEGWMRRMLIELEKPDRIPPKSSWRQDSKIWYSLRPSIHEENEVLRLERFGIDPEARFRQMEWFDDH